MIRNLSSLIFLIVGSICLGSTLHVPGDYPTIPQAITASIDGDTILVAPGIYTEENSILNISKSIILRSEFGHESTIIDGQNGSGTGIIVGETGHIEFEIQGFTIQNCQSPGGSTQSGGGINCIESDLTLSECFLKDNLATGQGGGIYCEDSNIVLSNCEFQSNTCNWEGGGFCCYNSNIQMTCCLFDGNSSLSEGGGVKAHLENQTGIISHCIFSGNSGFSGGGISVHGNITISDCSVFDNTASHYGGGLSVGSDCTVSNCDIYGNTSDYQGGGVDIGNSILSNCRIFNNSANYQYLYAGGGGVYIGAYRSPLITNCQLTENQSNNNYGGGICFGYLSSPTIESCYLENNTALYGGGIGGGGSRDENDGILRAVAFIIDCKIISNQAVKGGGCYFNNLDDVNFCNNLVIDNSSANEGGGLFFLDSAISIKNSTISGNFGNSGGGIYCNNTYPITTLIRDSILWNDLPEELLVMGSNNPIVLYSDIEMESGVYPGTGNLNQDPAFIAQSLGDYFLSHIDAGQTETSPCINTGSDFSSSICFTLQQESICLSEMSVRSDHMADSGIADMGYHYIFEDLITPTPTNTPTTTNTPTPTNSSTITPTFTCTPSPSITATPTITPTLTPYPTNTPFPTSTPYPTPTSIIPNTPTTLPTYTPDPTYTPNPTYTPLPTPICENFGTKLYMPSNEFEPGDACFCKVYICNPNAESYFQVPLFVILEVYENLYFAPSFGDYDYFTLDVDPGLTIRTVLESFSWPQGVGFAHGIYWYSAMTNSEMTALLGEMDSFEFGWSEN